MSKQRSAVVTGASRGIGRAIAVRLAKDGYDIAFCSRADDDNAAETGRLVTAQGVRMFHSACDVTDYEAVQAFLKQAEAEVGPPYAVVTSAGIVRDKPLALMSPLAWTSVLETNLTGTYHICRAAVGGLIRRREGVVTTISSVSGEHGNAGQVNYAASKAGINGLTKALAKEVAPFGIRVNALAPGFIKTEMLDGMTEKAQAAAIAKIGLGRLGAPAAVADLVGFLTSASGDYITGQVINVDGGLVL